MKNPSCTQSLSPDAAIKLLFGIILCFLFLLPTPAILAGNKRPETIQIGILAKRGKRECRKKWGPTINYLNSAIPDYRFLLVRLNFAELPGAVATSREPTARRPTPVRKLRRRPKRSEIQPHGMSRAMSVIPLPKNESQGPIHEKIGLLRSSPSCGLLMTNCGKPFRNGYKPFAILCAPKTSARPSFGKFGRKSTS